MTALFATIATMSSESPELTWLAPGQAFPEISMSWDTHTPAPGLLAAGGRLDVATLCSAYSLGIFPWFSHGQPILWWCPDPRMVLTCSDFRLHPSFRKALKKFRRHAECEIRIDFAFEQVVRACASSARQGQSGTWIVPDMISAYCALHEAGFAHSVETWIHGELVGGLYCVGLGKSVFGESMFSLRPEASKFALAALVAFCRHHAITQIDCQQQTRHLASLGARAMPRRQFLEGVACGLAQPAPAWRFAHPYWDELNPLEPAPA